MALARYGTPGVDGWLHVAVPLAAFAVDGWDMTNVGSLSFSGVDDGEWPTACLHARELGCDFGLDVDIICGFWKCN